MSCQLFFDTMHNEFQESLSNSELSHDVRFHIPEIYGHGHYDMYHMDDFMLTYQNGNFFDHTFVNGYTDLPFCFITVVLEGTHAFQINNQKHVYQFKPGKIYCAIAQSQDTVRSQMKANCTNALLSFAFSPEVLLSFFKEFDDTELLRKLENAKEFEVLHEVSISAKHRVIIEKLFQNPYRGTLKKMHRDCHSARLLLSLLEDLCKKRKNSCFLDEEDIRRLHKAHTILLHDLQNPPTIKDLSKKVALNEDKLKKGFKSLFETTIYKKLTQERMNQALTQVKAGEMNVSQIAFEAGYENTSSFIATFKKTYGMTPGVMREEFLSKKYYNVG